MPVKTSTRYPQLLRSRSLLNISSAAEPLALARLPTASIFRSLLLGAFFSSSILFTPGFALLKKIANSPSRILNPDRNPLLRAIVKPFVYDHFCAGTNRLEIRGRISQIKSLGFSGVILCYGKEIQIQKPNVSQRDDLQYSHQAFDQELELWKQGNLETLDMIGDGDYLGIKFTGAGKSITEDLLRGNDPPTALVETMDAIIQKAASQNCRIWIDAEQQVLQPSIDRWTIDLMRKYNRNGEAVLYNTLQAYLKESRKKLEHQLQAAHREGWTLAIKLVRGAYIQNDIRDRIHDTKAQTDESYDSIVRDLLSGNVNGVPEQEFPKIKLFLAGHNAISVAKASNLIRDLQEQGRLKTLPEFGQLQGMADQLGCELLQFGEDMARACKSSKHPVKIPRVYKCLTWGSVRECMQYLVRRAVENRGATGAVKDGMPALARELRRRMIDGLMGRGRTTS
ncbi:proline oxidase PrnD [Usnea florida]